MTAQTTSDDATRVSSDATVPFRLEVVVVPVADVDRAKDFATAALAVRLPGVAAGTTAERRWAGAGATRIAA
jgi:hypothetical protein